MDMGKQSDYGVFRNFTWTYLAGGKESQNSKNRLETE